MLRQENALLRTQFKDQFTRIQMLHRSTSNLDYLHHLDNNDAVEPLDCAVLFGQVPHTILSSHGNATHLTLGFRECWSLKALMRQTTPLDELLVYSNLGSQQQMRLPHVEAT